jgi:AraC-like DNA-binding protein
MDMCNEEYVQWRQNKLNDLKYHRAVCMMICGANLEEVAKELGMSKRNVQRFFEAPEFNENLTRAIQLTFKSSLSKAAVYADKALDLLIDIAEDVSTPVRYRLTAIHQIFEICFRANLQESKEETTADRISLGTKLLSSYNAVKSLSTDLSFKNRLNIENEKLVWTELYPNEPFPREEEFKKWFKVHELGEG